MNGPMDQKEWTWPWLQEAPSNLEHYASKRVAQVTFIGLDLTRSADRLTGVLQRNGVKTDQPCLFVLEGSLYNFEDEAAARLLQSFPRGHKKNLIVATTFQQRMLKWVHDAKNQEKQPFLAGLAKHW